MSKKRVNPTMTTSPVIDKANFQTGDLLPSDAVNAHLSKLMNSTPEPTTRSKSRKETNKGTVVFSAMIEKTLMQKLRFEAAATEGSMSEILNEALRAYLKD